MDSHPCRKLLSNRKKRSLYTVIYEMQWTPLRQYITLSICAGRYAIPTLNYAQNRIRVLPHTLGRANVFLQITGEEEPSEFQKYLHLWSKVGILIDSYSKETGPTALQRSSLIQRGCRALGQTSHRRRPYPLLVKPILISRETNTEYKARYVACLHNVDRISAFLCVRGRSRQGSLIEDPLPRSKKNATEAKRNLCTRNHRPGGNGNIIVGEWSKRITINVSAPHIIMLCVIRLHNLPAMMFPLSERRRSPKSLQLLSLSLCFDYS